jgi:DNA-binding beta-propeller fold protein YncE
VNVSRLLCTLHFALCTSLVLAQTEGPTLTPLWNLTTDFAAPESAYYDAASNSVFVSSINGQILEKDGNGYISRLSPDGKIVNAKWVTGLNAPKGLRSVGGTLWVADIDEVVGVEIASGKIATRVKVDGSQFLNDLATAPDGTVYVSDSALSRIYAVKDGKSSVFVEGGDVVEQPNGLLVDGSRLILGTIGPAAPPGGGRGPAPPGRGDGPPPPAPAARGRGPAASGHLFAFDLKTKQRTQLTTEAVGGIDGIEPDGSGGLLVTDVFGARLLHVAKSGQVRVLARFSAGGADFGYIGAKRIAVVPFLFGNSVAAYDLTSALK